MAKIEVTAAYDESVIGEVPKDDKQQVFDKLATVYGLYQNRDVWIPKHHMIEIFERFNHLVGSRKEEIIMTAANEGGKPYIDSKIEIERGMEGVKVAIAEMGRMSGEVIPMGHTKTSTNRLALTVHEPRGVVVGLSAFNHPFNLVIHQVIPALAVGCPVMIKPAANTPLSCKLVVDLLHDAGLPKEWCQFFLCDNDVTGALIADQRVSFLTFIGSAKVGWMLRSKLAPGAHCALEHGGVAPVIVDKSANINNAIAPLVKGGFYHAGQVCVSVQRIFVDAAIQAEFSENYVAAVKQLKVGNPASPDTEVGPLIRPGEVDRVENWVKEAVDAGAECLCGGERISRTCFQPTVLLNPPKDCKLSQNEVFGPVVSIYSYQDRQEAIRLANEPNVAFQAAVYAQDIDLAMDTATRLNGLAVMINDHTAFRVDWMPFGGYKESGLGVGGIGYSMRDMSIEKLMVIKSPSLP